MGDAADVLGDTGDSAPDRWEEQLRPGELQLLLTVAAQTDDGARSRRRPPA